MPSSDQETTASRAQRIHVVTPGRLHLGFIDMSGASGRRFGSVGLTVAGLDTEVALQIADGPGHEVEGPAVAATYLQRALAVVGARDTMRLDVLRQPPAHAGFGSGTQLALAIGSAVLAWAGQEHDATRIAHFMQRGQRSGIGVGAFDAGGFLVDGGHGPDTVVPPVTVRIPFPSEWRVLLVMDPADQGLSGAAETAAFANLPEFPREVALRLAHGLLTVALPALVERDLPRFGAVISEVQACTCDHFASGQGGRFRRPGVSRMLAWLAANGAHAIGQSSWGPTGFAVVADGEAADRLAAGFAAQPAAREHGLTLRITTGCNVGARIIRHTEPLSSSLEASR